MSNEDLADHERRIGELERKVTELYRRIAQAEPVALAGASGATSGGIDPRVAELVASGDKIGAIKLHRELTGSGLAEAKDAIDGM